MAKYTFTSWLESDTVYPPDAHYVPWENPSSYYEPLHMVMMDANALDVLQAYGCLPKSELLRIRSAQKKVWDCYVKQGGKNVEADFVQNYNNVPEN